MSVNSTKNSTRS